jgi:hypothetical protein
MMLRGTFRDGVIIPDQSDGLRNGDVVDIVRKRAAKATGRNGTGARKNGGTKKKGTKAKAGALFGFGLLKNKAEWRGRSSVEIAAELRKKVMRRAGSV